MNRPKKSLIKIGVLDVLSKTMLIIAAQTPPLFWNSLGETLFTHTRILLIVLGIGFAIAVEIAVLFLVANGYAVGIVLKSLYNIYCCLYFLMNIRLVFLLTASTMFQSRISIHIFLLVLSGLHFVLSVYFQYVSMFNKSIRAYISEVRRERIQKSSKNV